MKKSIILCALGLVGAAAGAEEVGRVISSTPVIQQVAVPRQVCTQQPVAVEQPTTGAGGVMGAIAGGAVGSQIGSGGGRAAATVLGVLGGAILGNQIEGGNRTQLQNVQNCTTQMHYENRTVAYNVTYEYGGKQHTVQMPYDPGPTIRLQVTPVGSTSDAGRPPVAYGQPLVTAPVVTVPQVLHTPVTVLPPPVIVADAYPAYYYRRPWYGAAYSPWAYPSYYPGYYSPIGFTLSIGSSRHSHGGHWYGRDYGWRGGDYGWRGGDRNWRGTTPFTGRTGSHRGSPPAIDRP